MTRVIVDTSAYSAFMRGHQELTHALQQADEIYLNPVIIGELLAGFMRGRHRKKNRMELDQFVTSPRVSIVDINEETAERYAVILNALWKAGMPIPTNDIWIAASAMQHGCRLLTVDAHYQKVDQILVEYFEVY